MEKLQSRGRFRDFSLSRLVIYLFFFLLCPATPRMCGAPDYTLPGTAESRGSETSLVKPIRAHSLDHTAQILTIRFRAVIL